MTLVEICEPLFQYVCKINRLGRLGGSAGAGVVRDELKALLRDIKESAEAKGQGGQFERVERPLMFFADFMVRESRLAGKWPPGWRNLSDDIQELAPDDRFFEALQQTLAEGGEAANHRLAVFYTMMGLGYTGYRDPTELRPKMNDIAARVRGLVEADQSGRICPDAYDHVDTRALTQPPARSVVGMVIALVGMVVVLVGSYVYIYRQQTGELRESLQKVSGEAK